MTIMDQRPIGALASAMWDAGNTTGLSEQGPEENDRQLARAERVLGWLRRFNYDVTPVAAQAAPALPRWYNLVCARCGEDIRRREKTAPALDAEATQ